MDTNDNKGFASIFATSFATIFIAELGDKTQIATFMLSAESGHPIIVFIGSALALIFSSIIGVLVGKWIANKIPAKKFSLFAGFLMTFISAWIGFTLLRGLI